MTRENCGDLPRGNKEEVLERLVRKAQRGDKNAFVALIEQNQLSLYRAAKAILHREEDVEDAVQETVCKAFYKLSDLRQPKYFKTWLTRILINCCYDLLRQQKGLVPLEILPEEGVEEEHETSLDVQRILNELGENDRLVLTLYYLNDISVKDIAGMLSINEGAVKQRLSHGRKKFREAYEGREQGKVVARHAKK
jgi:RNA polymerase sigma factor (sigma-70 family)